VESLFEAAQELNDKGSPGGANSDNTLLFNVGSVSADTWDINVPVSLGPAGGSIDLGGGRLLLSGGADIQNMTISNGLVQIGGSANLSNATFSNAYVYLNGPKAMASQVTLDTSQLFVTGDGGTLDQLKATGGSMVGLLGSQITVQNSEFTDSGLALQAGSSNNVVRGNYIHGDAHSVLAILASTGNTIGGTGSADRNVIWNNGNQAINLNGDNNVIEGNYLGTDQSGMAAGGTTAFGIFSKGGNANHDIIDTNVISGNSLGGIKIGGTGNLINGNLIGVDASGQNPLPNGSPGNSLDAGGVTLLSGSKNSLSNNVISANYDGGVNLLDDGDDFLVGNLIGTDSTGTTTTGTNGKPLGNIGAGVTISNLGTGDTILGGPARPSVISGNTGDGIDIDDNGCQVEGTFIGTSFGGTKALGNGGDGIYIISGNNTIGYPDNDLANVISGNGGSGIHIQGSAASGNLVQNNYIGTSRDDISLKLPNANAGIFLDNAPNNTIGDVSAGLLSNYIAHNSGTGVKVFSGTGNAILSTRIFDNVDTPEIQLQSGGNNQIHSPTVQSAMLSQSAGTLTLLVTLDPADGFQSGTTYIVQFFSNDAQDTGGGPGKHYLATLTTTFNLNPNTNLLEATASSVPIGFQDGFISATVTDPQNNTSQFSDNVAISTGPNGAGAARGGRGGGGGGAGRWGSSGGSSGGGFSGSADPNFVSDFHQGQPHPSLLIMMPTALEALSSVRGPEDRASGTGPRRDRPAPAANPLGRGHEPPLPDNFEPKIL
jgi:hypothetical protein